MTETHGTTAVADTLTKKMYELKHRIRRKTFVGIQCNLIILEKRVSYIILLKKKKKIGNKYFYTENTDFYYYYYYIELGLNFSNFKKKIVSRLRRNSLISCQTKFTEDDGVSFYFLSN